MEEEKTFLVLGQAAMNGRQLVTLNVNKKGVCLKVSGWITVFSFLHYGVKGYNLFIIRDLKSFLFTSLELFCNIYFERRKSWICFPTSKLALLLFLLTVDWDSQTLPASPKDTRLVFKVEDKLSVLFLGV